MMSSLRSAERSKTTCLRLLAAESEAAVQTILDSVPEAKDRSNWRPLDKRETNFNVMSNQASDGGKALTELMTNMVDAVLMKHAHQKGIDPEGNGVPKTMYEAVDSLIKDLRGGKLVNLDSTDSWLRDFARENLIIGITGARKKNDGLPCYTFADNGEGQHARDFESTFLSLSAGNKKSIPFVQGKFNMGSSGVLGYCGRNWFKLIVSRRYDCIGGWAWTIMRRRPDNADGLPVAEYLILDGAEIPSFGDDLLCPFHTSDGEPYDDVILEAGTIVKLYDYQVGTKLPSSRGARDILNENLVETILPFRLLDFRPAPATRKALAAAPDRGVGAHAPESRPFYGMEFLLLRSHREDGLADEDDDAAGEGTIFVGNIKDPELGEVSIRAILLRRDIPAWLKPPNSRNRVFHTVNGQVQYKQTRGYLSTCRFPALKDRVVIIVDASDLTFHAHNEVWKGDRENIRNTIVGERYRETVNTTIRDSAELQKLQKSIAQDELQHAFKAESDDTFQKLVNSDRNLADLLSRREPSIHLPARGDGNDGPASDESDWKDGRYSPTFVRLENQFAKNGVDIPINRARQVVAQTDAENGYLNRSDNPGKVIIDDSVRLRFGIREYLQDGRLALHFEAVEDALAVGDTFIFKIALKDDAMPEAVESEDLVLRVAEAQLPQSPGSKSGGKNSKGRNTPTLELPKFVLLTRNGKQVDEYPTEPWPEDFNEYDGGMMEDLGGDGVVYKINYDNAVHHKSLKQQGSRAARAVVTRKYILGMRVLMLGYEHALRSLQSANGGDDNGIAEYADEFRRMAARGAASTVLTLSENLPKIVDPSSIGDDIE